MSPELINQKGGQLGYDGRSVDVWASGILLLVMLLGSFPFDHTQHPDPNTSEAHLEVWLQQVSKRWSEVPHMAEAVKKASAAALCCAAP
jgi:serine/threonine-protein kinase SRK2